MEQEVIDAVASKENDEQPTLSSVLNPPSTGKRNKRSGRHDSLELAYQGIVFTERLRSQQPGSPHRFFASSYDVSFNNQEEPSSSVDDSKPPLPKQQQKQVVHCHVNGLCVVTAGEKLPPNVAMRQFSFLVNQAPACSTGQRRKRQAKMLKQGVSTTTKNTTTKNTTTTTTSTRATTTTDGTVTPSTVLAELTLENGEIIPLRACVWGTVLELNHNLISNVSTLLEKDPLLDGYLAILTPTGTFPPPPSSIHQHPNAPPDNDTTDNSGDNTHATNVATS